RIRGGGGDLVRHLIGRKGVLLPDDGVELDVDLWQDVWLHLIEQCGAEQENEERHHNEGVSPPQYQCNYKYRGGAGIVIWDVVKSAGCKPSCAICASTRSDKIRCGKKEISHDLASSSSRTRWMIWPESGYAFW